MTEGDAVPRDVGTIAAGREHQLPHQAIWTIADQLLSSTANFVLAIAVARAVDERLGGAFTYTLLLFTFALGLMRTITTDPLLIRFSAEEREVRRPAVAQAAGSSVILGVVAATLAVTAGLLVGGDLGLALVLLAAVVPGHFLQDSWRSAAFAIGDARKAAINDAVRLVCQSAALGICLWADTSQLGWYMGSWAVSAWAAALVGWWQFGRPGRWRQSTAWLRENAGLSMRLGGDFAINIGGIALTTTLLAAVLGLAATGGLRFAQTLLGPIQVLFGAVAAFMVPFLVRRLAACGSQALRRPAVLLSLGCFLASALVVGLLMVLPDVAGRELLGDSWDNARAVLLPVGVTQSAIAIALGGGLPLKAMGRADLLLRVTLIQAPLIFALALGGASWHGIEGAAWGIAIGQTVGCAILVGLAHQIMSKGRGPSDMQPVKDRPS
jgi:O-antigen/teichoic acid export membrane protein